MTNSSRVDRLINLGTTQTSAGDIASNIKLFTIRTRYAIPLTTVLKLTTNNNSVGGSLGSFKYTALGARGEYLFKQQQIRVFVDLNHTNASGQNGSTTSTIQNIIDFTQNSIQVGSSKRFGKKHDFILTLGLMSHNDSGVTKTGTISTPKSSFTNSNMRFHYEYRF